MATVIGIDPGKATGVAVLTNVDFHRRSFHLHAAYTIGWSERFTLWSILETYKRDLAGIAIEDFRLYPNQETIKAQTFGDFPSAKVIERVTVYCEQLALAHLVSMQMASVNYIAKGKKRPIAMEYRKLLPTTHTIDAFLHAEYYILLNKNKALDII